MLISWRRILSFSVWSLILITVWWFAAWLAARALVVNTIAPSNADTIMILSGSSAYLERTHLAAKLFQRGLAPLVVLTDDNQKGGWSKEKQRNPYSYEFATEELVRAGVPPSRIIVLDGQVTSTYDEAKLLKNWALNEHKSAHLIVTSAYHSRRANWTFERVFQSSGLSFSVLSVPPGQQTPTPAKWWWYANGWESVAGEYVKLGYYWVWYRNG